MIKFEVLKQIANNLENTEYEDIFRLLKELEITYAMSFSIPKGFLVSRIRPSGEIPYNNESQISFNPEPKYFGRANKPNEPIFYCSLQAPGMISSLDTNVWEWSNILNKKSVDEINFPISFTAGFWEIQSNLPTLPLIYNSALQRKFKLFEPLLKKYKKHKGKTELSEKIIEFLAIEFSKTNIRTPNDYKLTAAFSDYIRKRIGNKIPSILYPSVRTTDNGFNLAITPINVEKYLKLIRVETFSAYSGNGILVLDKENIITDIKSDGTFNIPTTRNLEISKGPKWCINKINSM